MLKVILFYKYTNIEDPTKFKEEHLKFCNDLGLKGRILVATEGINGSVCGTSEQISKYEENLSSDQRFSGIEFKEESCLMHPFGKMKIKIKNELVRFEQHVDWKDAGTNLSPTEFVEMAKQDDSIILDARNDYESRVGKFKGAIIPDIQTFREFPKVLTKLKGMENKKILMYCTGGIRCEKASAYLKKNGFNQVYQLHGGILTFGKEIKDDLWEGKCFVFDKRLLSDMNDKEKPTTYCDLCSTPCDLYKNCRNIICDKLTAVCLQCEKDFGGCCSKECFKEIIKG